MFREFFFAGRLMKKYIWKLKSFQNAFSDRTKITLFRLLLVFQMYQLSLCYNYRSGWVALLQNLLVRCVFRRPNNIYTSTIWLKCWNVCVCVWLGHIMDRIDTILSSVRDWIIQRVSVLITGCVMACGPLVRHQCSHFHECVFTLNELTNLPLYFASRHWVFIILYTFRIEWVWDFVRLFFSFFWCHFSNIKLVFWTEYGFSFRCTR